MIVNAKQYEELRHQMLRQAAPCLWFLLSTPVLHHRSQAKLERWQKRALAELRRVAKFPIPDRGYLDFE